MQPEKIKPVQDCEWGPWHATVCSKSCGGGVQTLKRIKKQRRRYGKAKNILYILFSLFRKYFFCIDRHLKIFFTFPDVYLPNFTFQFFKI